MYFVEKIPSDSSEDLNVVRCWSRKCHLFGKSLVFLEEIPKIFHFDIPNIKKSVFCLSILCSSSFSSSIFYQMKIQMQSNRYHRTWFACAEFMLLVFEHFPRLWRHWGLAPVSRRHRTCFPRSTWTEVCSTLQSCWDDYAPGLNQILSARRKALT